MNYVHGECLSMLAISHILQQLLIGSLEFYIPYNILRAVLIRDNYSIHAYDDGENDVYMYDRYLLAIRPVTCLVVNL